MIYTYKKEINIKKIEKEIRATPLGDFYEGLSYIKDSFNIDFNFTKKLTLEEKEQLNQLVSTHEKLDVFEITKNKVREAIEFGNELILEFATENTVLGITQLGLTGQVIKVTSNVLSALQRGAFHVTIDEIRNIPEQELDEVILTPERLKVFRNRIESFLGIPESKEWNE